ncbi:MAG: hypothetical protein DHS20C07_16780 [Methyloligella sp.]|nr:MAG: hypothetical protein DHS20C07_16780 [Methyloligella sp.]
MPKDQPNNFPREGETNPVTRDHLEQLKANRPIPNTSLDYTIGGGTEAVVHASVEAERNYSITTGERILKRSSYDLDHSFTFKSLEGHSKAQFGTAHDRAKAEYVKQQQSHSQASPEPSQEQNQPSLKEQYIKTQQEVSHSVSAPSYQQSVEPSR